MLECLAGDLVGTAYRTAGTTYFGEKNYGDLARATVGLSTVIRANTIPVTLEKFKGSALHQWVTVRGYETSNAVLLATDMISIKDATSTAYTVLQKEMDKK